MDAVPAPGQLCGVDNPQGGARSRPRLRRHAVTQHAPAMCPRQQLHHDHGQAAWQGAHLVQCRRVPRACPGCVHLAPVSPPRKLDAHLRVSARLVARRVQQLVDLKNSGITASSAIAQLLSRSQRPTEARSALQSSRNWAKMGDTNDAGSASGGPTNGRKHSNVGPPLRCWYLAHTLLSLNELGASSTEICSASSALEAAATAEANTATSQEPSTTPASTSVSSGYSVAAAASAASRSAGTFVSLSGPHFTRRKVTSDGSQSSFASASQRRLNCATVSVGDAAVSSYCVPSTCVGFTHSTKPGGNAWETGVARPSTHRQRDQVQQNNHTK